MIHLFVLAGLMSITGSVWSAEETRVPHEFRQGAIASAEEVNANFRTLGSAINSNAAEIAAIQGASNGRPMTFTAKQEIAEGQNQIVFSFDTQEACGGTFSLGQFILSSDQRFRAPETRFFNFDRFNWFVSIPLPGETDTALTRTQQDNEITIDLASPLAMPDPLVANVSFSGTRVTRRTQISVLLGGWCS